MQSFVEIYTQNLQQRLRFVYVSECFPLYHYIKQMRCHALKVLRKHLQKVTPIQD